MPMMTIAAMDDDSTRPIRDGRRMSEATRARLFVCATVAAQKAVSQKLATAAATTPKNDAATAIGRRRAREIIADF